MSSVADVATVARDRVPLEKARKVPPRPLLRDIPPADHFPIDDFDGILRDASIAIQDKTQTPMAICAQSVLGAATLAVQAHADVILPTGQPRPVSNYFVTVAESGERKSSCDHEALSAIRKREAQLREENDLAWPAYNNDKEAWDAQRKQALKNKDLEAKRVALATIGPEPVQPLNPMLTLSEPTFEGLTKLFAIGQPSLGLYSAEGGQFIGGFGMSPENKLRTAAGLSSLWDGEPIKRVRAGDGASILPGCRFSLHLMAQPDVASVMLSDRVLVNQGMLSRVLVAAPDSTIGTRQWQEPKPESDILIKRYEAHLLDILECPFTLAEGKQNELCPRGLNLSPNSRKQWIGFADHIEQQLGSGGDLTAIKGLASKLPEHAARLGGVLTLVDDIQAVEISDLHMAAGIVLAQYYAGEALRLFQAGATDPSLLLAQRTLDWLQSSWSEELVSLRVLYQKGPNAIRDAKTARMVCATLEEHGWLERVDGGAVVDGVRSNDVWKIVGEG